MKKNTILLLLIAEFKNNNIFNDVLFNTLEAKQENKKEKYYYLLDILETNYCYFNFSDLVYDLLKIIEKRLNAEITKDNILKALEVLSVRE